jgi:hypothetical protein
MVEAIYYILNIVWHENLIITKTVSMLAQSQTARLQAQTCTDM